MAHMYFLNAFVSRRNKMRRGGDEEEDRVGKNNMGCISKIRDPKNSLVSY